ncbi:MAG: hypothetical protein JOZ96_11600 [Acidobacteria bacterium]|nr:hypothetical protein [Acidobacteriota bacterium]
MEASGNIIHTAVNRKLRELWRAHLASDAWPEAIPKLWPLQYQPMEPGKLLFVGLNPSHNQRDNQLMSIQVGKGIDPFSDEHANFILRCDEESMGLHGGRLHPYFRQFSRFDPTGKWNHIDLFAIRHTNQSEVVAALRLNEDAGFSSPFVRAQVELAFSLMAELHPPAVVVVNALGSTIVKRYLNEQNPNFDLDDETGFYWSPINGRRVPFFFSGMLTGQRAIDNHSLERLIWHVRRALTFQATA